MCVLSLDLVFYGNAGAENSQHIVLKAQRTFEHYILLLIGLLGLTQRLQNFLEILKFVRKTISKEDITMYNFGLLDILEIVFPHHFQGKCPYFGP